MSWVRPAIDNMAGYAPGEQPGDTDWVKLNTNENPYPPSPSTLAVAQHELELARLYPDPGSRALCESAARVFGARPEQIMATNGSDEMLRILCQACTEPGDTIVSFSPSYTYYLSLAEIQGAKLESIQFDSNYQLPEYDASQRAILARAKLVFLPNPNSPSGTSVPRESIEQLCKIAHHCPVVVDEAYADFADFSAIEMLDDHPNLVVVRTLSKSYSLAGVRVGFGIANPDLLGALHKVRDSYNLNRLSQAVGKAALDDQAWFRANIDRVIASRRRLTAELEKLGSKVFPSAANFVLARFPGRDGGELLQGLRDAGILVRYFDRPRLRDCLRITVGTDEQVDQLVAALRPLMSDQSPA